MATLKLKIGADNKVEFTVTQDDGTAKNLTGGTLKFKVAKDISVTDISAEYFGEYTSFTDATNGIHVETIPDSVSGLWTPGTYQMQSRFVDSASLVCDSDVDTCILEESLIDNE